MGAVYHGLGQYPKALEFDQQALAIAQQIGNSTTEKTILNTISEVQRQLEKLAK
jgi:Tetratricopeptide repeat